MAGCYAYVADQARLGRQSFIVCPLVEASELRQDSTAVEDHFAELSTGPLSGLRTACIHGRLDGGEKDEIMRRFSAGEVDVLFSTTVIEVGIDVPNATTMLIENASQFGLTQLHQLRGRVPGTLIRCFARQARDKRGARLRICEMSGSTWRRRISLRGPGEVTGFRQAGFDDPHAAAWAGDARLLDRTRRRAEAILADDPELADAAWDPLRARIEACESAAL